MNENYRKMNNDSKQLKQEQWIGTKQRFNKKQNNNVNNKNNELSDRVNNTDKNWIGQIANKNIIQSKVQTPKNSNPQKSNISTNQKKLQNISRNRIQSPYNKISNSLVSKTTSQISRNTQLQQKSPMKLMNDIFRSIGLYHLSNTKTYYSRQTQDYLCQLLSNKNKMNSYLKKLSNQMAQAPPQVQRNYEILYTLLHQLSQADLQIHQDENGMKIYFNRQQLIEKERQVQRLQRELQQKNKQTQKIVQEYQAVIRNFNDVIEKLIHQKKY